MKIAKAGQLLCVESGEFSDFQVHGFFTILRDFCPENELNSFFDENPNQKDDWKFENEDFLAFLARKELIKDENYSTLYLGSYGIANFSFTEALDEK